MHLISHAIITENDKYIEMCNSSYREWPLKSSTKLQVVSHNFPLPWQLFQAALHL